MFNKRTTKNELMDDLLLASPALQKNLDELVTMNYWLGSKKALISALNKIYKKHTALFQHKKISIADLGCGSGDLLRAVSVWAKSKKLLVELIGFDANPFIVHYAGKKSQAFNNICYNVSNVMSDEFKTSKFDIICLSSFCHHIGDTELVDLLEQLKQQANLAVIINDLHRHWFAYYTIKIISKLFNLSYLAKYDAPLSVLRAFRKQELIHYAHLAKINHYEISWAWAFRWIMIIWC